MKLRYITGAVLVLITMISGCSGCKQINEGERGIKTTFGKADTDVMMPGIHFYNPLTSAIKDFDVKERKTAGTAPSFTSDTQTATVAYAITFYPKNDAVVGIFKQFGNDWEAKIVDQAIMTAIKDAISQYKADDLISKRETVRQIAEDNLKVVFRERGVVLTKLDITNIDFDDGYEKAVEAKVTAKQRAEEAKNKTVQIEEEAKQTTAKAKAEAEAMRIKSQALSQNKGLVSFEWVQKWNGVLPTIVGSQGAQILNIPKEIMSEK